MSTISSCSCGETSSKLPGVTGWRPRRRLDDGLKRTVDWYQQRTRNTARHDCAMREPIKASRYIAEFLVRAGGEPRLRAGRRHDHSLDRLDPRNGNPRLVSVHHEQAAAFAADAMGRMTGVPGVAMATSGPGATNLLTGIGSCYFDSSPGGVHHRPGQPRRAKGRSGDPPTRLPGDGHRRDGEPHHQGRMACPVRRRAAARLAEAFALARSGRPGRSCSTSRWTCSVRRCRRARPAVSSAPAQNPSPGRRRGARRARRARRPLILAGGGVRGSRGTGLLRRFVEMVRVPVVHSLLACDVLPYTHPLRVGMIGSYGNRWANLAIGRADLLLVLGSRLDVRQTGSMDRCVSRGIGRSTTSIAKPGR